MAKQSFAVLSAIQHDGKEFPAGKTLVLDTEADASTIEALTVAGALGEPALAKGKKDEKSLRPDDAADDEEEGRTILINALRRS
jgi:hypothetical protein